MPLISFRFSPSYFAHAISSEGLIKASYWCVFLGKILIMIAVITFSLSTMFGYSYYGRKCTSYIFGTKWKTSYNVFYVIMIIVASTISIDIAINFMDSAFALMVIPTMVGSLLLAPKVLIESEKYFDKI